jgi:hypothetical protein
VAHIKYGYVYNSKHQASFPLRIAIPHQTFKQFCEPDGAPCPALTIKDAAQRVVEAGGARQIVAHSSQQQLTQT